MPPLSRNRALRLALALALLAASRPVGPAAQEPPTIRTEVQQIFVPVTVSSQAGEPVIDLTRKDFHLFEDGIEQEIINCAREEVPLNVVFLMDISHSTFMELGAIKKAVRTFVGALRSDDRVAIVTFNNEARLIPRLVQRPGAPGPRAGAGGAQGEHRLVRRALRPTPSCCRRCGARRGDRVGDRRGHVESDGFPATSCARPPRPIPRCTSSRRPPASATTPSTTSGSTASSTTRPGSWRSCTPRTPSSRSSPTRRAAASSNRAGAGSIEEVYSRLVRELRQQYYRSRPRRTTCCATASTARSRCADLAWVVSHRPGYEARRRRRGIKEGGGHGAVASHAQHLPGGIHGRRQDQRGRGTGAPGHRRRRGSGSPKRPLERRWWRSSAVTANRTSEAAGIAVPP